MSDARAERIIAAPEAAALVRDGMVVGLSGFSYQNPPMALVREVARRRVRDLTLVSGPTSGLETDLLIGAGCVRRVVTACVAFERVLAIAPAFRQAAERGDLAVWECDECIWHLALKAGAWGMPHLLWRGGVGSSLPELNDDLEEVEVEGRRYVKVPPIRPDVVFVHAAEADAYGNVRLPREAYLGRSFAERALALACRGPVVASVERIVPNEEVTDDPARTLLRGAQVVVAPWGAHPGGTTGRYVPDLDHYRDYAAAGEARRKGDPVAYQGYLERTVYGPQDHDDYLKTVGRDRLAALRLRTHRDGGGGRG
ncbi:MAG: CoA transferase subunit A, partial [Candidatus Polarisedimenticolia bacterium]